MLPHRPLEARLRSHPSLQRNTDFLLLVHRASEASRREYSQLAGNFQ